MIFVDTAAWFALTIESDERHDAAIRWITSNRDGLVTTDYIIAEALTLLRGRGELLHALGFAERAAKARLARIDFVTQVDFDESLDVFRRYSDKDWSFTDCTSKVVMERLGIQTAFTFDHHFKQFGTITIVP